MNDRRLVFLAALKPLIGLRLFNTGYAANMRTFGFSRLGAPVDVVSGESEWSLHISCSWRIESEGRIITGSFDWYQPADPRDDPGEQWDPVGGGSLQDKKLRELLDDNDRSKRVLMNRTDFLVVEGVDAEASGDVTIELTGSYRLRVFPAGSRGEFWRIFNMIDDKNYFVCELDTEARYSN